jgi:hypothetical protein
MRFLIAILVFLTEFGLGFRLVFPELSKPTYGVTTKLWDRVFGTMLR